MRPKQTQRISTFHAHESILDTLSEVYKDNPEGLGPAAISTRTGFYRKHTMNDAIVTGFLHELEELGKVKHYPRSEVSKGTWKLTEEEYEKRREDSD